MGAEWSVTTDKQRDDFVAFVKKLDLGTGYVFSWKKKTSKRSLSANALAHMWFAQAATFFDMKESQGLKPPEVMKLVFKQLFLGTEDVVLTGKMTITGQLRQTSKLDKGEMCHFMTQIDDWCASKGCALSHPADSEYSKWMEEQVK